MKERKLWLYLQCVVAYLPSLLCLSFNYSLSQLQPAFVDLFHRWEPFCSLNNSILLRSHDSTKKLEYVPRLKWTFGSDDIFYFNSHMNVLGHRKPPCRTVQDAVGNIFLAPSLQSCQLTWFNASGVQRILQQYEYIIFNGDSLMRHLLNGLFMLLSGDLQHGAYPLQVSNLKSEMREQCVCDGQFSEAELCRDYDILKGFESFAKDFYNISLTYSHMSISWHHIIDNALLCANKTALKLVYIQGGSHFKTNPSQTIDKLLNKSMRHLQKVLRECGLEHQLGREIQVLFSGVQSVAPSLEAAYPHQSAANVIAFNSALSSYISKHYPFILMIDFTAMSFDGVNRTSDGFHKLSDINAMQAMSLVNVMNLLLPSIL